MKRKIHFKCFLLVCCCFFFETTNAQNLLDTSAWTIGSGSVAGFSQNGATNENVRVYGENHVGENVILWRGGNDPDSNADGGWKTTYFPIDNSKTYRLSVWIKKTNSNNGHTYFGCQQWRPDLTIFSSTVFNLNNAVDRNPYFWVGDLPKLDRWYLLVGFVHGKNSSITTSQGAIYDGVTGKFVRNIRDFKFTPSTTLLRHRTFLYYDNDINDRQYFYAPRIEVVGGSEPPINSLLRINPNSRVKFDFDIAGNQKTRYYCPNGNCSLSRIAPTDTKDELAETETDIDDSAEPQDLDFLDKSITLYPNPPKNKAFIKIGSQSDLSFTSYVNLYNVSGALIYSSYLNANKKEVEIDLNDKPSGLYHIHLHLSNGKSVTKRIIKN